MIQAVTKAVAGKSVAKDVESLESWANQEAQILLAQLRKAVNSRSPLNVRWYGAKGDGVTNDAPAFQAAADAAALTGGTIDVPEGVYLIESTISFGNDTFLRGAGRGATILRFSIDADSDGLSWSAPTQYGTGGGIMDMKLWVSTTNDDVRDMLVVKFWQKFHAARVDIVGSSRYAIFAPDGLDNTFFDCKHASCELGAWVGDYRYAQGITSNYNADGLHCDITPATTPAVDEWEGRVITFLGSVARTITANTAASPSTITFNGPALTAPQRAALAGTNAYVELGSVATTQRFISCYAISTLSGPGFDLGGISLDCVACVCEGVGNDADVPGVRMRHGTGSWTGGHLEGNRSYEFHLGVEGPTYFTVISPVVASGPLKVLHAGPAGIHGGPYLHGGGWFGGDMSNGGLTTVLDLDSGGGGFAFLGVATGTKVPTYAGGSIDSYNGMISYIDPSTGAAVFTGSTFLHGHFMQPLGVGTLSPLYDLHVHGTATDKGMLIDVPVAAGARTFLLMGSTGHANGGIIVAQDGVGGKIDAKLCAGTDSTGASPGYIVYSNLDTTAGQEAATLATTATDGHHFIPSCNGVPTGVPQVHTGKMAIIGNSATGVLYCYSTTLAAWVAQV